MASLFYKINKLQEYCVFPISKMDAHVLFIFMGINNFSVHIISIYWYGNIYGKDIEVANTTKGYLIRDFKFAKFHAPKHTVNEL
jgi:hypothetical protein